MPQSEKKKESFLEKFDFIERVFVKLFGAASKDAKSAMLAVSFIIIGAMFWRNDQLAKKLYACNEVRVVDKQEQYNEILRLLLPEIARKVENEVEEKTRPIGEKVENVDKTLGELTKAVKERVKEISE